MNNNSNLYLSLSDSLSTMKAQREALDTIRLLLSYSASGTELDGFSNGLGTLLIGITEQLSDVESQIDAAVKILSEATKSERGSNRAPADEVVITAVVNQ